MAIRKIYTNGELVLEVKWSKDGIHLFINHYIPDELPPTEFIIEAADVNEFINDIECYSIEVIRENNE